MSIKIKKVKVAKGRTLEVTLIEHILVNEIPTQIETVKKCDYLVHQDLLEKFDNLRPHMINICELGCSEIDVKVTGFTIAEGKDGEGVVLIGSKNLTTGKLLNLVAPLTEYFGEEYSFGSEMEDQVDQCIEEVKLYLDGKSAVKQTAINFDEDDLGDVNIGDVEEPKKKGRKKKIKATLSVDGIEEIPIELDHAV